MRKSNIIQQLREVAYCLIVDSNIQAMPTGSIARMDLNDRKIKFLRDMLDFILNTDKFITKETRYYITHKYITKKGIAEQFNVNIKTVSTRIWRDKSKIAHIFGDHVIEDTIYYKNSDISRYEKALEVAISKYSNIDNLLNNIDLKLPEPVYTTQKPQEFDDFMDFMPGYLKSQKRCHEEAITPEVVGYIKWLLTTKKELSPDDLKLKEWLMVLLGAYDELDDNEANDKDTGFQSFQF